MLHSQLMGEPSCDASRRAGSCTSFSLTPSDVRDNVPELDWDSGARPRSFHPRADVEDRAGVPADYGPDVGRPDEVPHLPASPQVCGIDR